MQSIEKLKALVDTIMGRRKPTLLLRNCRLVNVLTEEVYSADISCCDERIAAIAGHLDVEADTVVNCRGLLAVPGLLDGHTHIESTLLSPAELARVMVPRGTSAIFMDPHEVGAVLGLRGVAELMAAVREQPFRGFLQVPSRVPQAPGLETTGGELGLAELRQMATWPDVASLGEIDYTKVIQLKDEYLEKIRVFQEAHRVVNGCSAGVKDLPLNAYIAVGIADDHGARTPEELMDRLRLGMTTIQIRESTSSKDLRTLLQAVRKYHLNTRRLSFCDDDKNVKDLVASGHMDQNVIMAMEEGVPPMQALQMATINCAEHFRMEYDLGCIAAGRYADIVLLQDYESFPPEMVVFSGQVVARNGELVVPARPYPFPDWFRRTVKLPIGLTVERLLARSPSTTSARVIVMETYEANLRNKAVQATLPVRDGYVCADLQQGINHLCVVERYGKNGNVAHGFIRGFNLQRGAMASSIAHDHHNLIVVGADPGDMLLAVLKLEEMGGGQVVTAGGAVIATMPLALAGLMSDQPYEVVLEQQSAVNRAAQSIGCPRQAPFMDLGFVCLPTVPELGMTDRGLVDALRQEIIPLFAE